jgi:hypothetical protein
MPLSIDANDALPGSLWRQGWTAVRSEDPVIVKVRVEEVKEAAIAGGIIVGHNTRYSIHIDHASSAYRKWLGGDFQVSNLPFIFSVYQLQDGSLVGKESAAAKSFVAGVLAAGGTAELCYHLRVHKIYEKFHVDVTQ